VRYRDDRALRSKAEKIHHRKEAAKENALKEAEAKKSLEEKAEGEVEVSYFQNVLEVCDPSATLDQPPKQIQLTDTALWIAVAK
jgi:hypothetical protein